MSNNINISHLAIALLGLSFLQAIGHTTSRSPLPPIDYSKETLSFLEEKLESLDEKERASAAYSMAGRHKLVESYDDEFKRSYKLLKNRLPKETDQYVRDSIWVGISNMITAGDLGARMFNQDRRYWLKLINDGTDDWGAFYGLFLISEFDVSPFTAFFGPNPPPSRSITRHPVGAYPASVSDHYPPLFRG